MNRTVAVAGSILFFCLAPGVVAAVIPLLLSQWQVEPVWRDLPAVAWTGVTVGAAGLVLLVDCFARFALEGRGTPAPVAPTQTLVVTGLYRHMRNPMYVAVMTIILGEALWFASWPILAYGALVWLYFTTFVMTYEEPTLRAAHGAVYEVYCANVGRWIPRLTPWSPAV